MDGDSRYRLNPALDEDAASQAFRRKGRLHLPAFLVEEDAARLHRFLKESEAWKLVVNQKEKLFELDRSAQAALSPDQKRAFDTAVHAEARRSFQFLFESIRVPDEETERRSADSELTRFASFLSSEPVIALLRRITGLGGIDFADAQATAYGLGHFLTRHDDAVAGKNRLAAYVFNLTPKWHVDWGGLLIFHAADGHVEEAFTPAFNALNIFAVPQLHSVSFVTPFAASRRYSVTGWLRSRAP